jgi:hypothetical protein
MSFIDFILDVWDVMLDISESVMDFFSNLDDLLGGLQLGGFLFGTMSCALVFFLSPFMLKPFLLYMEPLGKIVWTILTYVACFGVGYFLGEKLFGD